MLLHLILLATGAGLFADDTSNFFSAALPAVILYHDAYNNLQCTSILHIQMYLFGFVVQNHSASVTQDLKFCHLGSQELFECWLCLPF